MNEDHIFILLEKYSKSGAEVMKIKKIDDQIPQFCEIPRRHESIEALFQLAWRKQKKDWPNWLKKELSPYT